LGAYRSASAGTLTLPYNITGGTSWTIDGWNIAVPAGNTTVTVLSESNGGSQLNIEKDASFSSAGQVVPISFTWVSSGASVIDVQDEVIHNDTGSPFSGFDFVLTGSAAFYSVADAFNSTDAGFSSVSLNGSSGSNILSYSGGSQPTGTTFWNPGGALEPGPGLGNVNDNLFIDASSASDFSLKEFAPGASSAVPLPAAAWQSLAGLAGLALYGIVRRLKHRPGV
jgi:hypothetical protein